MHFYYNSNPNNEFKLDGIILESIVTEKDLDLTVSHDLEWDINIKLCFKDSNREICWIASNLLKRDPVIITHIHKTIIRPKQEYCVQLWNREACHGNWSTILKLELIQRRLVNDILT